MSTRTPGPWWMGIEETRVDGQFHLIFGPSLDPDLKIEPLAQVMFAEEFDVRLMAAAPELLDAAQSALALLRGSGFTDNTEAIQKLKSAIAKADGR